ncbi:MAG: transaldolase family protein [Spirochaetales bacterium]
MKRVVKKSLMDSIKEEKKGWEKASPTVLWETLLQGQEEAIRGALLYFSDRNTLEKRFSFLEKKIKAHFATLPHKEKKTLLHFLLHLSLDLRSFPAERGLKNCMEAEEIQGFFQRAKDLLLYNLPLDSVLAKEVEEEIRKHTRARLQAEGITDPKELETAVAALCGGGMLRYMEQLIHEYEKSNLRQVAQQALQGKVPTELGNDYADFLDTMIRVGGSFVTTNPVLIKLAWDIDPSYWDPQVDEVIRSSYTKRKLHALLAGKPEELSSAVEKINALITASVVERNCRLLRPIFLLSEGKQGYVSVQVNPKAHHDSNHMVKEAVFIYKELEKRLSGVPNIVIKVPSTAAGLKAAEQLTSKGIGVTITLTFSLFQALPFAEVLQKGNALVSYIAIMNGRLAFPVRDELKSLGVERGVEAARWAGVEVARKAAHRLYSDSEKGGLGVDPEKVKIMIASLRIYDDWIPDISELWGIPLITIFPNVRRAYDRHTRGLVPDSLHGATPEEDLRVLLQSEIFRQAWWVPENGEVGKPKRPLALADTDAAAVAHWKPVQETLTQFIGMYQEMSEKVKNRMEGLAKG